MSVKITGIGIISVYGDDPEVIAENIKINKMPYGEKILVKGKDFYRIKDFDHRPYLGEKGLRFWDPSALIVGSAVKKVLDQSEVLQRYKPEEICFALGKGKAEHMQMEYTESVLIDPIFGPNPGMIPNLSSNAIAGQVAIKFGFKGENITFSNRNLDFQHHITYVLRKINHSVSKIYLFAISLDRATICLSLERKDQANRKCQCDINILELFNISLADWEMHFAVNVL